MGIDGVLDFMIHNHKFNAEIKKEVKNHQLYNLIENKNKFKNFLLVAEKLYPKTKKELSENNINYIAVNGNAYINKDGVYLFIDINKPLKTQKREIANIANVGLGNIPQIINGLLDTNYLIRLNTKEYIINDYAALLDKWITAYAQTLRPTLFKQRFKFQNSNLNWKDIPLNTHKTLWGGEPAGDILTHHLHPEKYILNTTETTRDLMINQVFLKNQQTLNNIRARRSDTSQSWISAIFFIMNLITMSKIADKYAIFCAFFEKWIKNSFINLFETASLPFLTLLFFNS